MLPKNEKKYKRIHNAVKSVNQEFFDSFVILGNDPDGNVYVIEHMNSQVDEICLTATIKKYVDRININDLIVDDMDNMSSLDD